MKTKLNKTTENFLNYSYKGDGKYYITEQGSKSYRNTTFNNFFKNNSKFCKLTDIGNDAPRGGQTGDFFMVEFTAEFKAIAKTFNDAKIETENRAEASKQARKALIASYAGLIPSIEGELRIETEQRLSAVLTEKIDATIFHKAVSFVRNNNTPFL